MSFENLGLQAGLLRALSEQGYAVPTAIQARAIPIALAGGDLMAAAQTGTGKTAAFALPILQRLMQPRTSPARAVRALVLVPTRELAAQVAASLHDYGRHMPLRSAQVFGGVKMGPQVQALRGGIDVLVATPGRLLDHLSQRSVDLSRVETLVLDEADRMLDMGFLPDVERIIERLPAARQTLLFSATFPDPIRALARRFQRDPAIVEVARRNAPAHTVVQQAYWVDQDRKRELLTHLIWDGRWQQVLVFTRTKHGADRLARHLVREKVQTAVIHGDKTQSARTRALADFKRQAVRVLVATDIAARGLDIDDLPHVVNFELPHVAEDYVHRIGRTGRAGREGTAVSLVCHEERSRFEAIRHLVKVDIPATTISGFEPSAAQRSAQHAPDRAAKSPAHRAARPQDPRVHSGWRRPKNPTRRRDAAR